MRILLTGVGGPAGICFAKSLHDVQGIELIGANAEEEAMGKKFVKKFYLLPFANDPEFMDSLQEIIKTEKIDYLIPLVDEELPIISKNVQQLGCDVLVSPYETIQHTTDKGRLYDLLASFLPKRYTQNNATFPLFVKPKIGRGGKGAYVIVSENELKQFDESTHVYQELLTGPEITVDTLFDFTGNLLIAIQRVRTKVEQGISVSGEIINDIEIFEAVKKISKLMTFIGPINFQFMRSPNGYRLLEINARSSGGMGITIHAGADIPKLSLELLHSDVVSHMPFVKQGIFRNFDEILERQKAKSLQIN